MVAAKTPQREHPRDRGQSLVEFALVAIPLALLLLGAIQFGIIWATQVGVTNAVRDSTRAASLVQPKADIQGNVTQASEQSFAANLLSSILLPALQKNVPFYNSASVTTGQICYSSITNVDQTTSLQATVTVTYAHPILIPLVASVLGGNSLSATASLTIPVGLDQPFALPTPTDPPGCAP